MAKDTTPAPVTPADLTTATFLTSDEVAALLRIDVRTVRRWCGDGQIAHARIVGRHWRVPRVELERFIGHALADLR